MPEEAVKPEPEVIGGYTVHPAASLFPLLLDDDAIFDELRSSIEERGQLLPILVQGNMLLDGRNRLRACLKLNIEPKVEEYSGPRTPIELISDLNLSRRELEPDQRTAIVVQLYAMGLEEKAQKAKQAAGKEYGKSHPKLTANSPSAMSEPKTRARDARSTAGQIAAKAKVSRHKAAQALALAKNAPDLLEDVRKKKTSLNAATKKICKPAKQQEKSFLDTSTRLVGRIRKVLKDFPHHRDELKAAILKVF